MLVAKVASAQVGCPTSLNLQCDKSKTHLGVSGCAVHGAKAVPLGLLLIYTSIRKWQTTSYVHNPVEN